MLKLNDSKFKLDGYEAVHFGGIEHAGRSGVQNTLACGRGLTVMGEQSHGHISSSRLLEQRIH